MMNQPTLEKMAAMKMSAMVGAFEQQLASRSYGKLSFEERLGMLIDAEYADREQRKLTRRLQQARLRQPNACIEDIDFKARRGLKRQAVMALGRCDWIPDALNVVFTGPTGTRR
jgi:DNA replication protein DnaC